MRKFISVGLMASTLAVGSIIHEPRSATASPAIRPVAAQADACGFRNAAWQAVQFTSDKASAVNPSQLNMNSADATFLHQAVLDWIADIARDYGKPNGWQAVQASAGGVMAAIHDALYEYEDEGVFEASIMGTARDYQAAAWRNLKSICPGGGNSRTDTGVLTMYHWMNNTSPSFTVPSGWTVNYNFDCSGNADYDKHDGTGHVIVTAQSSSASPATVVADRYGKTGNGTTRVSTGGKFRIKVQSECYWHFHVFSPSGSASIPTPAPVATVIGWRANAVKVELPGVNLDTFNDSSIVYAPSLSQVKVGQRVEIVLLAFTPEVRAHTTVYVAVRLSREGKTVQFAKWKSELLESDSGNYPAWADYFTPRQPGRYTATGTLFVGTKHQNKSVTFTVMVR